jgi:hypothetical protein
LYRHDTTTIHVTILIVDHDSHDIDRQQAATILYCESSRPDHGQRYYYYDYYYYVIVVVIVVLGGLDNE